MTGFIKHLAICCCVVWLALHGASALAEDCNPLLCTLVSGDLHDIGNHTLLTIPSHWRFYNIPVTAQPGVIDNRIYTDDMEIEISGFPNPSANHQRVAEQSTQEIVVKRGARFLASTNQSAVHYLSVSHDEVVGGYASFDMVFSKPPLMPYPNYPSASVTLVVLAFNDMVYLVTIASKTWGNPDVQAALELFRQLH